MRRRRRGRDMNVDAIIPSRGMVSIRVGVRQSERSCTGEVSRGIMMNPQASRAVSLSGVLVGGLMAVVITALSAGCREATTAAAEPLPTVEIEPAAEQD